MSGRRGWRQKDAFPRGKAGLALQGCSHSSTVPAGLMESGCCGACDPGMVLGAVGGRRQTRLLGGQVPHAARGTEEGQGRHSITHERD